MYQVSFGAVRRRRGQAVLVLLLAALVAAVAAAGPWYGLAVASRAAGATIGAAPATQRVVSAQRAGDVGTDPRGALDAFAAEVGRLLPLPGGAPITGLMENTSYSDPRQANAVSALPLTYRDDFCAHARLTGTCPSAAGDGAISADAARRLKVRVGDVLKTHSADPAGTVRLRITAVYEVAGPSGVYWTDGLFRAQGDLDPIFVTLDEFRLPQLARPTLAYDVPVPTPLLRGDGLYDLNGVLNAAQPRMAAAGLQFDNQAGKLFDKVRTERSTVLVAVLIAAGQVVVLGWFAIALAGRFTGRERRADAALLKLRGSSRGGLLRLSAWQQLPPLAGAAVVGLPVGIVAARLVAGRSPVHAEWFYGVLFGAAAVLAVLTGAFLALLLADAVAQRAPVAALLRRVPTARRDWRSGVIDLAFVAIAAGAVYQARTGGPRSGLGQVAPVLVALAAGLVLARLLRLAADRAGGAAVKAGRLRAGLTAVQISRQPGGDRVFALIVVAVAALALTLGGLAAGRGERAARADVQLGAARVLTVRSSSASALLTAVRKADPGGRQAMAALVDTSAEPAVLAVDSSRLADVARWRPEYGPVTALGAAAADARVPGAAPLVTGDTLTLRIRSDRKVPSLFGATVQNDATGAVSEAEFTDIRTGDQTVTAKITGCTVAPGCHLIDFELFSAVGPDGNPVPGALTVEGLGQLNPSASVVSTAMLADVTRWRTDYPGLAVQMSVSAAGLRVAAVSDQPGEVSTTSIYPIDVPVPVPVVLAGRPDDAWRLQDSITTRFGGHTVPVQVVAATQLLPVIGRSGILVDLDTERHVAAGALLAGRMEVWLAPGAPSSVVDALRAQGLTVLSDSTTAGLAARWAAGADVVTEPFGLLTAAVMLLLAAVMIGVLAAVERSPRLEQLRALRMQGLPRGVALATAYAVPSALVITGLLAGVAAALTARPTAHVVAPPFADGWRVIPPPGALGAASLGIAAAAGLIVLAAAAWLSVRPLAHRLHDEGTR